VTLPRFPIGLSNGPPPQGRAPNGRNGLAEIAAAGVNLIRTGRGDWNAADFDAQIASERSLLDLLRQHALSAWLWLGNLPNLPAGGSSPEQELLSGVAESLRGHPALAAYKGIDEPANPYRTPAPIPAAGLVRAYRRLKQLDPSHPIVITQAPINTLAELIPYRPAFDITGADAYPVSYPPAKHTGGANRDITVVGDVTAKMVEASAGKPVWMTLQIAWSGVIPTESAPGNVPRFPSFPAERLMAYQAIARGARGLIFFGGHLTEIASPADAAAGWNWSFWEHVLRPLVAELSSPELAPALTAPAANAPIRVSTSGIELAAREAEGFLYLLALRRSGTTSRVRFTGLPARISSGEALFEYVQEPLPPPVRPGHQAFRPISVSGGSFGDWFATHDVHVYRFAL
jgi:hypothetical protein